MIKPMGTFKPLSSNKAKEVMSGNLKKAPAMRSITMQFTEEDIERIDKESEELEIVRNKFIGIALDHYWRCNNVK